MLDLITLASTNLYRIYVIRKFMSLFFSVDKKSSRNEKAAYFLFFFSTAAVYLLFQFPPLTILANIITIYLIAQSYEGEQKKKLLVTFLIYGISMTCDILSVYSLSNYAVGESPSEIAPYITVFLTGICEFIIEKIIIKKKDTSSTPPHWDMLLAIPISSIVVLLILIMSNLNNQIALISVGSGLLIINLLTFYLYDVLVTAYLQLAENTVFEWQLASYSNQLEILMQSEEKVSELRHDMKHHINELLLLAGNQNNKKIIEYIHSMQMYLEHPQEYVDSGNKDIDSILNYMLGRAALLLNNVKHRINIPKEIAIRPFDMNIILGNLLDNAITAASHSSEKHLLVVLRYDAGMLFIHVRNSFAEKPVKEGDYFLSTKENPKEHGLGLKSVKRVVNSYHGTLDIAVGDHIFDVKVMLYTNQNLSSS